MDDDEWRGARAKGFELAQLLVRDKGKACRWQQHCMGMGQPGYCTVVQQWRRSVVRNAGTA